MDPSRVRVHKLTNGLQTLVLLGVLGTLMGWLAWSLGGRLLFGLVVAFILFSYVAAPRLSPRLVRRLGGTQAVRDQTSLRMLAGHAEDMLEDVARLADRSADGETVPSVSLAVEIALPDEGRREAFLEDLRHTFEDLARRYSTEPADGPTDDRERFRFTLACYPTSDEEAT